MSGKFFFARYILNIYSRRYILKIYLRRYVIKLIQARDEIRSESARLLRESAIGWELRFFFNRGEYQGEDKNV